MFNKMAILEKKLRESIAKEVYLDFLSNRVAYIKYMSAYPNDEIASNLFAKINETSGLEKEGLLQEAIKYFINEMEETTDVRTN